MNNIREQVTWISVQLHFSRVHFINFCKLGIDYFFNSQTTSVMPAKSYSDCCKSSHVSVLACRCEIWHVAVW